MQVKNLVVLFLKNVIGGYTYQLPCQSALPLRFVTLGYIIKSLQIAWKFRSNIFACYCMHEILTNPQHEILAIASGGAS